ncbi:hypothetical protein [Streptomyces beijiangensis]|uniref:Uncharacterized protein n=1 Tax=Streptomyces beijiangensis TaxID=163361 RepID=A0A939FG53_9ACTN|nr:hypothetical protein [Streptomyces beijiangensis]MBO0516480.1 hypothetical protein [Streptomyces beijiangensis]
MYLISAALAAPRSARPLSHTASVIADMLWLRATSADHLEHVRAHADAHEITLVLFLKGEDLTAAERASRRMCEGLVSTLPSLAGWDVLEYRPL